MTFDDEISYPLYCSKCGQLKIVDKAFAPRLGDPYICPGCREKGDEYVPENGDIG